MKKTFVCKVRHNRFKEGDKYTGLEFDNGILFTIKDTFGYDKKYQKNAKL